MAQRASREKEPGWGRFATRREPAWTSLNSFREAGHLIFGLGGDTLGILGSTPMQLIVPGTFVLALSWGWLDRDQTIGGMVHLVGVLIYAVAIVGGWMLLRRSSPST